MMTLGSACMRSKVTLEELYGLMSDPMTARYSGAIVRRYSASLRRSQPRTGSTGATGRAGRSNRGRAPAHHGSEPVAYKAERLLEHGRVGPGHIRHAALDDKRRRQDSAVSGGPKWRWPRVRCGSVPRPRP